MRAPYGPRLVSRKGFRHDARIIGEKGTAAADKREDEKRGVKKRLKQEYLPTQPTWHRARITHTLARTHPHTHVDTAVDVEA